ncbi:MAG: helix-turn-helix transcriptional regulator [Chloroflexota bacterium]|nr:helix-turn-helix transcriptional regulator [Chloroflexota bacterium]
MTTTMNFLNLANYAKDRELSDCPECHAKPNDPGRNVGPTVLAFTQRKFRAVCLACQYKTNPANTQQGAIDNWNAGSSVNMLKELRNDRGWTQKELAERAGLATITIHQAEKDSMKPSRETRCKIAKALGVGIHAF